MVRLLKTTPNYMLRTDVRNKLKTFNVDDVVNKLHACSANSFQILNKLNNNAYVIDFGVNSTFNVEDLVDYKGLDFILLVEESSLELIFERSHSRYFT